MKQERTGRGDRDRPARGVARPDGGTTEALDEVFSLLADRRRRYALYHLRERAGTGDREVSVGLRDLAREVAAFEQGTDPEQVLEDEYERVYLGLQHNHVPRLADAGVVEYDREQSTVAVVEVDEPLSACLELARDFERA